jgi:hypothetical protein
MAHRTWEGRRRSANQFCFNTPRFNALECERSRADFFSEDLMACHNAIWELAAALIETGINPDKLSHPELAAELTNHLVDGAVLIPGAAGTLLELREVTCPRPRSRRLSAADATAATRLILNCRRREACSARFRYS